MDKTTKAIVAIVIILLVVVGIYQVSKDDRGSESQNPTTQASQVYKVGVMLPLTGDAASVGEPTRGVMVMAAEEINAAGGINGAKLELIIEDSKCNGKDGANAAQKLINVDKVAAILGGACSSESLAALPLAIAAKVAMLSSISSSPDLTGASPFFTRDYPSDDYQGTVLAEQANKLGWKKVALLQEQTDYAAGLNKAFVTKYESLGGSVVQEEFPSTQTDFKSVLTKLRAENANALFIVAQTPASGERVIKQIQDLGWKPQLLVSDPVASEAAIVTKYAAQLEGAYAALFGADATNPKFKRMAADYKTKYGKDLTQETYAQTAYDSVYLMKDAIAAVGYDGTKIANWLHTVNNWQGASGSVTIGSNGDRASGHKPFIIKNGKTEPIAQ